jgi:hypothetical protein
MHSVLPWTQSLLCTDTPRKCQLTHDVSTSPVDRYLKHGSRPVQLRPPPHSSNGGQPTRSFGGRSSPKALSWRRTGRIGARTSNRHALGVFLPCNMFPPAQWRV